MRTSRLAAVLAVLAICIAALDLSSIRATASVASAPGPFSVRGARIYNGKSPWTPYGMSVGGLEHPGKPYLRHYATDPSWRDFIAADDAQITAAATAWHANVVRFQISGLMIDGGYPAFRAQLAKEIHRAESLGMAAIINYQTQWDLNGQGDVVTSGTYKFWRIIARLYGHDPHVIFDLLNEPQGGQEYTGASWQRTFQPLVDLIRKISPNQIWAEGPDGAGTLAPIRGHLLTGGNIVYAFHHPSHEFTSTAAALASWRAEFGWLAATHPVVNGEWSDWAATRPECWTNPAYVPLYLRFLAARHIGLVAWAIGYDGGSKDAGYTAGYSGPGVLATGPTTADPGAVGSYDTPSAIDPPGQPPWSCTDGLGQSAGALVQAWFANEEQR